ncbi:13712_t:CDS:1, partial [Dentiscutata heterogama]
MNSSQLEFTIQKFDEDFSNSFNPISEPHNKWLEEINNNKLSIEEIVDISNPAFIGSNNSFI